MEHMKNGPGGAKHRFWLILSMSAIPIFVLLAIWLHLTGLDSSIVFDPPTLLPVLNLLFLFLCPMVVGYLAARGYLSSGSASLLTLGGGVFSLAFGSLIAGFLLQAKGPNAVITIHNVSAFLAGVLHLTGATLAFVGFQPEEDIHKRKFKFIIICSGITAFLAILTFGVLQGVLPIFFVQGQGPTLLRQVILGIAVLSFLISGLLFFHLYRNSRSRFLYCYAVALLLISIGLGCVFIQKSFGGPIGWLGRIAQYIGGLYLFAAAFGGARELGVKVTQFDKLLEKFFRSRFEILLAERTAELALANERLRLEIDTREEAEKSSQESEAKYRSMMEAMDDPACICSKDFRVEYMNPAMIKRLGHDATGERCYKALHGLDEKCPWCIHERVMGGESIKTEVVSPKDGKIFYISNSPISHTHGSISKLTVFRDITETRKIEERLRQAQKMEAIGTLAGGIAHDFNNILEVILLNAEMLQSRFPGDQPVEDSIQSILKASHRAKDLVLQILTFGRQTTQEKLPFKLSLLAKEALKLLRASLPSNIEIRSNLDVEEDGVNADPTLVQQIVMNLCANAAHAMRERGGTLEVGITEPNANSVEANEETTFSQGDYVCLYVRDTGHGMSEEVQRRIFDPFFTTKPPGEGTGLGLAVVQGIMEAHEGKITVDSRLGQGTVFRAFFPSMKLVATPQSRSVADFQTGKERVLLVDDEEAVLAIVQAVLEHSGYTVTTATNPIRALEVFRARPDAYDLVLTDYMMPEMNGLELAGQLTSVRADVPIILFSGNKQQIPGEKLRTSGVRAVLTKPLTRKDLTDSVRRVLNENMGKEF